MTFFFILIMSQSQLILPPQPFDAKNILDIFNTKKKHIFETDSSDLGFLFG